MKKAKRFPLLVLGVFVTLMCFYSCNKEEEQTDSINNTLKKLHLAQQIV